MQNHARSGRKSGRLLTLSNSDPAETMRCVFRACAIAFVPNWRPSFRYLLVLCTCGLKTPPVTISGPIWVLWHPSTHPDLKPPVNIRSTKQGH